MAEVHKNVAVVLLLSEQEALTLKTAVRISADTMQQIILNPESGDPSVGVETLRKTRDTLRSLQDRIGLVGSK